MLIWRIDGADSPRISTQRVTGGGSCVKPLTVIQPPYGPRMHVEEALRPVLQNGSHRVTLDGKQTFGSREVSGVQFFQVDVSEWPRERRGKEGLPALVLGGRGCGVQLIRERLASDECFSPAGEPCTQVHWVDGSCQ